MHAALMPYVASPGRAKERRSSLNKERRRPAPRGDEYDP